MGAAWAKPMPAPTLKEGVRSAPVILVADYQAYRKGPGQAAIDYFDGPLARYRVVKVLKGTYTNRQAEIRYDFTDGSACLAKQGWTFTPARMPAENSRWILLLKAPLDTLPAAYATYRGEYGRQPWSDALEQKIEALLREP